MTVKELKEKLEDVPDDFIVMIPNGEWFMTEPPVFSVPATGAYDDWEDDYGHFFIFEYNKSKD